MAIAIVLLIQIIGTILVLALLTIPATLAALFTSRLWTMMVLACVLSCLATLFGFWGSYALNWPPGATIALVAAAAYLVGLGVRKNSLS